jgi:hypothetical protein
MKRKENDVLQKGNFLQFLKQVSIEVETFLSDESKYSDILS